MAMGSFLSEAGTIKIENPNPYIDCELSEIK